MRNHTYEITYADFGKVHVIARSLTDAVDMFVASYKEEKGNTPEIRNVTVLVDFVEPLYPKE